jgi:DNA-binding NarL/FixJ family response regulator
MIRVVVADDHALVRGGFQMILEAQPDIEVPEDPAAEGERSLAVTQKALGRVCDLGASR